MLVVENESRAREAVTLLRRVGLDQIAGWLDGGMHAWSVAGLPVDHVPQISAHELNTLSKNRPNPFILDVRGSLSMNLSISTAPSICLRRIPENPWRDTERRTVHIICNSGHRSSLASSVLKQHGFKEVINVAGGMTAFSAAGLIDACPTCTAPHLPASKESHQSK